MTRIAMEPLDASNIHTVRVNEIYRVNIQCDQVHTFNIEGIPSVAGYVLFEVHSQWYNVTLSYTEPITYGKYENGTNVGLIIEKTALMKSASTYIQCQNHTQAQNVKVLVKVTDHKSEDPIPGGCNMEYPLQEDPNVHGRYNAFYTNRLGFQYANVGHKPLSTKPKCETTQNVEELKYRLFQYHMKQGDFSENMFLDSMELVLNGNNSIDLTILGEEITTLKGKSKTEMVMARYKDHGVVYTVVVEQYSYSPNPDKSSTTPSLPKVTRSHYVPTVIYGCGDDTVLCVYMAAVEISAVVLLACLGIFGLFVAFMGHRYFQTEMFFFGYLALKIILLLILLKYTALGLSAAGVMVIGIGLLGGVLWWLFWYMKGIVLISILLPGFVTGFLLACVLFNYTPLGSLSVFEVHLNYGLAFSCAILLPTVCLLYFTKFLNIFCCSLVGTFLPVFAASLLFAGTFKNIILDTFRNIADNDYLSSYKYHALNTNDILFCVLWAVLILFALPFQLWREHKRPPFPPCPFEQYKKKRMLSVEISDGKTDSDTVNERLAVNSERAPLIKSPWQPDTAGGASGYGTSPGSRRVQTQKQEVIDPL